MWKTAFKNFWGSMVCLSRPNHFHFVKGCLQQILPGPFLNILTHIICLVQIVSNENNSNIQGILKVLWLSLSFYVSLQKQVLIFPFQFSWVLLNTARISSFCFNVRQDAVAFAVEDRSWLLSASSVTLMIPALSALIVASKSNFCFSTF